MSARLDYEPGVGAESFRALFRAHPAGVTVICADAGDGPAGFTATSLTSVSLDPPLVSFAIASTSSAWPTIRDAQSLTVNFLSAEQHVIATRFATSGIDRFGAPTLWSRLESGEPVLDDAPAFLRAVVTERIEAGDHHVVLALVVDAETGGSHEPLVYHAGGYCAAAPLE
ncbi:flavin reductase family protein [Glycomyces harbinensis]|uniref:NADH-FMN oxidoreductase RutF, flavin reductase (DIM6/NTAB) family n=1 Tax=Glycomyces harbinensis TaxID=58114 RepID=A0A1G6RU75_9ACTN|nr:flavin reductase family protein [Glycomyces harbinensis]SDD08108.1 NADH-FMN oxidoreductase RutF, flavin reductase (DIM6/NTAB) family [Glycomyces harbinensis]